MGSLGSSTSTTSSWQLPQNSVAWFENSPSRHFILADFPAWNFSGSGCAILRIRVERDIAPHIMKKSRSWHWNMDWLQDAKFSGENSAGVLCQWCAVYYGCGQSLSSLASADALGETCSLCKAGQRVPFTTACICTSLANAALACWGWAVSEHLPGSEVVFLLL